MGDFNNDRQADVVVANSGTDSIWIFLSYGNATLVTTHMYSTGSESLPYSVVVDNFNNDNCLDIAVANYGTHNIAIYLGHCNGSFADPRMFPTSSSRPLFITSGDFNNDNRSDIVTANYGTNTIGLFLGCGNGSFQSEKRFFTGYDSILYSLATGDFNEDNQLDIAIANYGTNNMGILLGYANGSFAEQQIYSTGRNSNPASIAIADLNNDTHLDIVIANYGSDSISIFLGYGNGSFVPQMKHRVDSNARLQHVNIDDFDGDNVFDVFVVDSSNNRIHILLGNGNGTFATTVTADGLSGIRPSSVAVADFNNDHRPDIVLTYYDMNKLSLIAGYFMQPWFRQNNYFLTPSSHPNTIAISDFNNNSYLDIVVNSYTTSSIYILFDYAHGTFARGVSLFTGDRSNPQSVYVIDLNYDNHMDIVTANMDSDTVGVLLGRGDGTFTTVITYSAGIGSRPVSVTVGDINNDNRLDIVTANKDGNVSVFLGNGNGSFSAVRTYPLGINAIASSIALGDANNNKQLDIFVAMTYPPYVIILLDYSNGVFGQVSTYSTGYNSAPASIALADFNNDNQLDIVVGNVGSSSLSLFYGYGNGTFRTIENYAIGTDFSPYSIIIADFNYDDRLDIATTDFQNSNIFIFFGDGNGSFEKLSIRYPTGNGTKPYAIAIADLNNDNRSEIVVALWGTGSVGILTGYNAATFPFQSVYSLDFAPLPYSLATGDFNNDSQSDIVVANSGTDDISVLLGLGNGTFQAKVKYPVQVGFHPQSVLAADVDNDDQLDILTVNSNIDSMSIFLGRSNGSFKDQKLLALEHGSYPYQVISGDLNNDNRIDLIIAGRDINKIGIMLGYDYASFQNQQLYAGMGNLGARAVVVNDFNNDNYLDIAVTFYRSNTIGVLLGYGNGSFGALMNYSIGIGSSPYALLADDIDGDSRIDMITANLESASISILFGYGNGSFANPMNFSTGYGSGPVSIAAADFNDDSLLDIVVINSGTDNIGIFYQQDNRSFAPMVTYLSENGYELVATTANDFNNDGKMDIAVVNCNVDSVGIFLGYGNGSFAKQMTYSTGYGTRPSWVAFGDFNNDRYLDMASTDSSDNTISILLGYGNGSFATAKAYYTGIGSTPIYLTIDDFNNDRKLDIAVINYGTNEIVLLFGFGDGTFLLGSAFSTGIGSRPNTLAVGDFNKDGRLDIAVAYYGWDNVGVFLGSHSEPFSGVWGTFIGKGARPYSVAIGDFDHDGSADIAVANYGTDNIGVLLGKGDGNLNDMITYSTGVGSAPYFVAIGDFNNDNHSDIVVSNSETDDIAIFLGYGNGTFAVRKTFSTGARSRPYALAVADFNHDNLLDIVIANSGTNNVLILYGLGNGTFGKEELYSLGYDYRPYAVVVTDLNQDDWMDIVIACYNTENVEILMQICQ